MIASKQSAQKGTTSSPRSSVQSGIQKSSAPLPSEHQTISSGDGEAGDNSGGDHAGGSGKDEDEEEEQESGLRGSSNTAGTTFETVSLMDLSVDDLPLMLSLHNGTWDKEQLDELFSKDGKS